MKANDSGRVEHRAGYWWRVLRPLLWWLLLMLTMFGYRKHQALMERTRIYFTTTVPGLANSIAATVILDGEPISTGTKISLGSHTLTVTHPKAETFATNFFAWYGGHDFGQVTLKRTMGMLKVAANPAAGGISIFGPEFSLQLTNSTGTNISVPTDVYRVYARYARWSDVQEMTVSASGMACNFNPQLGAISISCNESPATYQISNAKGDSVAKGEVPAVVAELPGGDYLISVTFNEHQLDHTNVRVSAEQTNDVPFHFVFGAARIDSVPTGATVVSPAGIYLGTTPLLLTELLPATASYQLQLAGYDTATVIVTVAEAQTNSVSGTLISLAYINNLRTAKEDMNGGNFRQALNELAQALKAKPGDSEALELQAKASANQQVLETKNKGGSLLEEAKNLAGQGDYIAAGHKLEAALQLLPASVEAKTLQAEYKTHEGAQILLAQQKETRRVFDEACQKHPVTSLLEEHQILAPNKTPAEVRDALIQLCQTNAPTLKVTFNRSHASDITELFLLQSSLNPLIQFRREALVVIGKGKDDQTVVLFKVIEYQRRPTGNLFAINIGINNPQDWVPVHPSRIPMTPAFEEQIRAGVRMMQEKINAAVGVGM